MQHIKIIGYGKMAEAILSGILKRFSDRFTFSVIGRDVQKAQQLAQKYQPLCQTPIAFSHDGFTDNYGHIHQPLALESNDIVLLAVKPYALRTIFTSGKALAVYSILAGVSLQDLTRCIAADRYVRAMPNIAASFNHSCTALYATESDTLATELFSACGEVIWLSSESKFDAAMALVGSAPAYLAMMAEALSDAGVREGLTREEANACVQGLFDGFSVLLKNKHPALIKEEVSSPAGVTIEGIAALESDGFRGSVIHAIHQVVAKVKRH